MPAAEAAGPPTSIVRLRPSHRSTTLSARKSHRRKQPTCLVITTPSQGLALAVDAAAAPRMELPQHDPPPPPALLLSAIPSMIPKQLHRRARQPQQMHRQTVSMLHGPPASSAAILLQAQDKARPAPRDGIEQPRWHRLRTRAVQPTIHAPSRSRGAHATSLLLPVRMLPMTILEDQARRVDRTTISAGSSTGLPLVLLVGREQAATQVPILASLLWGSRKLPRTPCLGGATSGASTLFRSIHPSRAIQKTLPRGRFQNQSRKSLPCCPIQKRHPQIRYHGFLSSSCASCALVNSPRPVWQDLSCFS